MAARIDGTTARIYINGVEKASVNTTASLPPQQDGFFLGHHGHPGNEADYFKGLIDEVRISNIARSPQEFNLQLPPKSLTSSPSGTTVNLTWQNGGGAAPLMRYRIYRGADSVNVTLLDSTTSTSYANTNVPPGTKYYRISAVDSTGFEGAKSYAVSALSLLNAQYEYNPDANTVLLLHMNETSGSTVSDASGNALNGTIVNTAAWQSGRFGNALNFSNQGYASIAHNDLLNLQDMTLEIWIYPTMPSLVMTGADAAMALISKRTYNSAEPYTLVIRDNEIFRLTLTTLHQDLTRTEGQQFQ